MIYCALLRYCIMLYVCVVQKVQHLQNHLCHRPNQFFFSSLAHVSCSACDFVALVCFGNLKADRVQKKGKIYGNPAKVTKKCCIFVKTSSKSSKTHLRKHT